MLPEHLLQRYCRCADGSIVVSSLLQKKSMDYGEITRSLHYRYLNENLKCN